MASRFSGLRTRISQISQAFSQTRAVDPRFVPILAGVALSTAVIVGVLFTLLFTLWFGILTAVLTGLLAALVVFGRRVQAAALGSIEGRAGAAAAVLENMRGPWQIEPAVAFNRRQDLVHRVSGRPGIILVGEGQRAGTTQLIKQEKRRTARVVGEVPVHEVYVGTGDGAVELRKLQSHIMKLPRSIKTREIGALRRRLGALGSTEDLPMPKGVMPKAPKKMR